MIWSQSNENFLSCTYLALSIYTLQKIMFMLEEIVYFMVKEPKGKTICVF